MVESLIFIGAGAGAGEKNPEPVKNRQATLVYISLILHYATLWYSFQWTASKGLNLTGVFFILLPVSIVYTSHGGGRCGNAKAKRLLINNNNNNNFLSTRIQNTLIRVKLIRYYDTIGKK